MRKTLVIVAIVVLLALGFWTTHTENKETAAVAETQVAAPAMSVQELQARYAEVKLTPAQQRLVAAGFSPERFHTITTKTTK